MATITVTVPEGLHWLALSLIFVPILLTWQSEVVMRARKLTKIEYPRLYAEKAEQDADVLVLKFNCKQRAHQNTLETLPNILIPTFLTAIKYPRVAAASLAIWIFSRVFYTAGYATGVPKKRNRGSFGYIGVITLIIGAVKVVYELFT